MHTPVGRSWKPRVITSTSLELKSTESVADLIGDFFETTLAAGEVTERRREQAVTSVWDHAHSEVKERIGAAPELQALVHELAREVADGHTSASLAGAAIAERVLMGKYREMVERAAKSGPEQ